MAHMITRGIRLPAAGLMLMFLSTGCDRFDKDDGEDTGRDALALSGGATTHFNATSQAFMLPAPNLDDLAEHFAGDQAFEAIFVSAPATVNGGLGPIFNNTACTHCHVSNGRGRPPEPGQPLESMLLRLSVPGPHPDGSAAPAPVPGYGGQLADKAVFGVQPEARVELTWQSVPGSFADGTGYTLLTPTYTVVDGYTDLPTDLLVSPRVAPPVFGAGLLEAIPEQTLLDLADPGDLDGDGVSGRPNLVLDMLSGQYRVGRFGWKAGQPTLVQQAAAAYANDMGITNPLFPVETMAGQPQHDGLPDDPEIDMATLEAAAFYTRTLAVPARRDVNDTQNRQGERLFEQVGCAACHLPELATGEFPGVPSVSNQVIRPYTDLLLHDMGPELADGRPEFEADGQEWKTPPLWGLGLTGMVSGHTRLLHDGRARSIEEAILWHGGEGDGSREAFRRLSAAERQALLAFLESL
jgi:CxxC motif-containing protein (DUF1111 family)